MCMRHLQVELKLRPCAVLWLRLSGHFCLQAYSDGRWGGEGLLSLLSQRNQVVQWLPVVHWDHGGAQRRRHQQRPWRVVPRGLARSVELEHARGRWRQCLEFRLVSIYDLWRMNIFYWHWRLIKVPFKNFLFVCTHFWAQIQMKADAYKSGWGMCG